MRDQPKADWKGAGSPIEVAEHEAHKEKDEPGGGQPSVKPGIGDETSLNFITETRYGNRCLTAATGSPKFDIRQDGD